MLQGEGGHCLHFLNYVTTTFSSEAPHASPLCLITPLLTAPLESSPCLFQGLEIRYFLTLSYHFLKFCLCLAILAFTIIIYCHAWPQQEGKSMCSSVSYLLSFHLTHPSSFFLCLPQQWALFFCLYFKITLYFTSVQILNNFFNNHPGCIT